MPKCDLFDKQKLGWIHHKIDMDGANYSLRVLFRTKQNLESNYKKKKNPQKDFQTLSLN
jgi:hypothetical protein